MGLVERAELAGLVGLVERAELAGLVGLVERAELVELVGLVESAGSVELAASVELVVLAGLVELVESAGGTVRPPYQQVGGAATGNTIHNIVAEHRIETGQPRIDLAGQHAVIRSPSAKPAHANKWDAKAAICRVTVAAGALAIGIPEEVLATEPEAEEEIVLEVGISHAAVAETAMPLVEVPEATTDLALAAAAVAALPAWDLAAGEASVEVAAVAEAGAVDDADSASLQSAKIGARE